MKKNFKVTLLFIFVLSFISVKAQKVDTVSVFSEKMERNIKNVVITPAGYDGNREFPVLYLLHGHGGRYDSWIGLKPSLPAEATKSGIIIVCPDGQNSWYWDSPIDPSMQFETFVSKELTAYIDKNYKTIQSPKGRAITGLSMGGHGGLWLGIRHSDIFGACGSMSGGVDIRPFPDNWNMKNWIGTYKENADRWENYTVINQVSKIEPETLSIIIDCGTEDFFYEVNEELHKKLLYHHIKHDYITRPGGHDGDYWRNAIDYQLLFFSKFFSSHK